MTKIQLFTITMTIVAVLLCFVFVNINQDNEPTYNPPTSSSTKNNDKTDKKQDDSTDTNQNDETNVVPDTTTPDLLQLYDFSLTKSSSSASALRENRMWIALEGENLFEQMNLDVYDIALTVTVYGYYEQANGYLNNAEIYQFTSDVVGLAHSTALSNGDCVFDFSSPYLLPPKYDSVTNPYSKAYAYNVNLLISNKNTNTSKSIDLSDFLIAYYNVNNELFITYMTLTATQKTN